MGFEDLKNKYKPLIESNARNLNESVDGLTKFRNDLPSIVATFIRPVVDELAATLLDMGLNPEVKMSAPITDLMGRTQIGLEQQSTSLVSLFFDPVPPDDLSRGRQVVKVPVVFVAHHSEAKIVGFVIVPRNAGGHGGYEKFLELDVAQVSQENIEGLLKWMMESVLSNKPLRIGR